MKHVTTRQSLATALALYLLLAVTSAAFAQSTTAFTYQGRLTDNSTLASGAYDLQFSLYDAVSAGTQQGANVTLSNVPVTGGIFTASLDFGSAPFAAGAPRFLQIGVRPGGSSSAFTLLTPRQPLAPTPYAIRALTATTADTATNATQLGGVNASQFVTGPVVSGVNGLSGNVTLAAGANVTLTPSGNTLTIAATGGSGGTGNVIQNSTTLQPNTNFNISGDGTAGGTLSGNVVNAATQFNLGGNRVLTVSGAGQNLNSNTFAGVGAGANTTPDTTTSIGNANAFFGNRAGAANTIGGGNAFFGYQAGAASTMGLTNAFFGASAGQTNTAGNRNAFVGSGAGLFSTTGSNNTFIGTEAGFGNLTGSSNTLLGSGTNVSFSGLSFATAIGAGAVVNTSNTITLGRSNGSDLVAIPGVLFAVGGLTAPGPINANGGLSVTGPINTNGGVTLNDSAIRLRDAGDAHHAIAYERSIDGIRFSAFDRFQWFRTGDNFEQMILQSNGDLTIRGNYFHNSDARYKTAVETLPQALDQVLRLRGVSYHWKPEFNRDPRRQIGLIAQEVEAVLPELVNTDDKGFKSVAYANAVPVLVEAIKEQQQQLDELKAVKTQLNRITNENAELKAQVEQLRQIVCATNPTAPLCQVAR